jgi:hypothetical protein
MEKVEEWFFCTLIRWSMFAVKFPDTSGFGSRSPLKALMLAMLRA